MMRGSRPWRVAAIVVAAAIAVAGVLPTQGAVHAVSGGRDDLVTSAGHFASYVLLAFVLAVALDDWRVSRRAILGAAAIAICLERSIELVQAPLPYRDCQLNLCPCGGRGDPAADCGCSPQRISAYREKVSRALLDRFDLVVAMPRPRADELAAPPGEPSARVRARVVAGRERLRDGDLLRRTEAASALLDRAVERVPLSGRGRARVARVARTIAALAGANAVLPEHLAEALSYRAPVGVSGA